MNIYDDGAAYGSDPDRDFEGEPGSSDTIYDDGAQYGPQGQ